MDVDSQKEEVCGLESNKGRNPEGDAVRGSDCREGRDTQGDAVPSLDCLEGRNPTSTGGTPTESKKPEGVPCKPMAKKSAEIYTNMTQKEKKADCTDIEVHASGQAKGVLQA